jgi:hypothetical protein
MNHKACLERKILRVRPFIFFVFLPLLIYRILCEDEKERENMAFTTHP